MSHSPDEIVAGKAAGKALGAWIVASVLAAALARIHPALGFAAAGGGGLVFGLFSAERVQRRRVRIRRQRAQAEGGP